MSQTSVSSTLANLRALKQVSHYPINGSLLSAGSQNPGTSIWAKDIFEKEYLTIDSSPYVKQYKVNESAEDLLALSVAWFRLRKNRTLTPYPMIESLLDENLFKFIQEEDRIKANEIRDYYAKKFVVLALKDVKLTKFREDMKKFIHSDGKLFINDMLPLVFRLPEFYEYDTAFADMMRDLTPRPIDRNLVRTEAHTLRPLRKFDVKRKHHFKHEYWFKDEQDHAVLIMLEHINSCKSLFEREFKKESIDMRITGFACTQDDLAYFKVNKWEVE